MQEPKFILQQPKFICSNRFLFAATDFYFGATVLQDLRTRTVASQCIALIPRDYNVTEITDKKNVLGAWDECDTWASYRSYAWDYRETPLYYSRLLRVKSPCNISLDFMVAGYLSHKISFGHHGVPVRLTCAANLRSNANVANGGIRRNEITSAKKK